MRIESITLKNFRAFKDVEIKNIPQLCILVGANGTGKSTLFQLFGFLQKAMRDNVTVALRSMGGVKGFQEVRTRDADGPIDISIQFRQEVEDAPLVTYWLQIDEETPGKPFVAREVLRYRRGSYGAPWHFLDFSKGQGYAITDELKEVKSPEELHRREQKLKSPDILAIKGLAQFADFPVVQAFGNLIENWHVSDFHIADARPEVEVGLAEHLSPTGDNLPLVAEYLHNNHPDVFANVLERLCRRVPGISKVEPKTTEEGKVLLRFGDSAFKEPFLARYVSDGTIKMFAYLVMLNDPAPHPLLCVEEPENQLYPALLPELVEEFREYADRGQQVFVSTHSYDFLNAARPEEVFWLTKKNGYTTVCRALDDERIVRMMREGDQMGRLWRMGYFVEADPDV